MTEISEISEKLTAALEAVREQSAAELAATTWAARESTAVELLVQASGGKRRFTRDGKTYVAHKAKDGTWSLGAPRVQKGVEA